MTPPEVFVEIWPRACLKNHSYNLHTPICGIFCLHSVAVAHYAALIQAKSPINCDAHLAESIFQTRSKIQKIYPEMKFKLITFENTPENAREILANMGKKKE